MIYLRPSSWGTLFTKSREECMIVKKHHLKKVFSFVFAVLVCLCGMQFVAAEEKEESLSLENEENTEPNEIESDSFPFYFISDGKLYKADKDSEILIDGEYTFKQIFSEYSLVFARGIDSDGNTHDVILGNAGEVNFEGKDKIIALQSVTGRANETTIYNYIRNTMGLNEAAACGMLANIQNESGFNPTAEGDNYTSYGICQWHASRKESLKNYCSKNSLDYRTLDGQLKYLEYELKNSFAGVWNHLRTTENTADGAYDAGAYWCAYFEKPAGYGEWKNGVLIYGSVTIARGNLAKNTYWAEYGTSVAACDGWLYTQYNDPDGEHSINADAAVGNELGTIPTEDGSGCGYVVVTKYSSDRKWGYVSYKGVTGWTRLYEPYIKYVSDYTCPVVTFNANGGTLSGDSTKKVYINTYYGTLPTASRIGYTFDGWYTSTQTQNPKYEITADTVVSVTVDQTYYAHWTPNNYTINYSANGGTGAPASQTKTHGQSINLSSLKPTRTGYTFKCWNTQADGSGTDWYPNETYSTNRDLFLYAKWEKVSISKSLFLHPNYGDNESMLLCFNESGEFAEIAPFERDGYEQIGWSLSPSSSEIAYGFADNNRTYITYDEMDGDVYLYAVWKANTYTITYNANGGTGSPSSQTKTHGQSINLRDATPTRIGYNFLFWTVTPDGGSCWYPGESYEGNRDLHLYAQWEAKTYTIAYNANGGTGAPSSQTKTHGKSIYLISSTPTRDGYDFIYWNTRADGSGVRWDPNDSYSIDADLYLYAQWKSVITPGDINGDGEIDYADAVMALKHDSGLVTLTGDKLTAADVNSDGEVDFNDAVLILKYDSGLISEFDVISKVYFVPENTTYLKVGEYFNVDAVARYMDGRFEPYASKLDMYVSSGENVVSVNGVKVTALKEGNATVRFRNKVGGLENESFYIVVTGDSKDENTISTITLPETSVTLYVGDTYDISATATYKDGSQRLFENTEAYIYSGSDYISLDGNTITGLKAGTAKIRFKNEYLSNRTFTVYIIDVSYRITRSYEKVTNADGEKVLTYTVYNPYTGKTEDIEAVNPNAAIAPAGTILSKSDSYLNNDDVYGTINPNLSSGSVELNTTLKTDKLGKLGWVEIESYDTDFATLRANLRVVGDTNVYNITGSTTVTFLDYSEATLKVVDATVLGSSSTAYRYKSNKSNKLRAFISAKKSAGSGYDAAFVMIVRD